LGTSTGDAEVWRYDGNSWQKVGGEGSGLLSPSWGNGYEHVPAMYLDGATLYVGLGLSGGDSEVWKCVDSECSVNDHWTKLGGDGNETGTQSWNTTKERVWSIEMIGTKLFVGLGDAAGDAEVWMCNTSGTCSPTEGWKKIGGDGTGSSWNTNYDRVYALTKYSTKIIAGLGLTAGEAEVWMCDTGVANNDCTDTSSWQVLANGDSSGSGGQSWGNAYEYTLALSVIDGDTNDYLYVAVSGSGNGEAEIWMCDLASTCTTTAGWQEVGGDTIGFSWTGNYDEVRSFYLTGTTLLAGITGNTQPGELWSGDCSSGTCSWTQLGGNYINGSWGYTGLDRVISSATNGNYLYFGTGSGAGDATVWQYNGSIWSLIGGQNINNGWGGTFDKYETVDSLVSYKGSLYAGLGTSNDDGTVWKWNGSAWTQIGGVGSDGWVDADNVNRVYSMASDDTYLYAGLGSGTDEGDVWRYNGSSWEQIAGLASPALTNGSWQNADNIDGVTSMVSDGNYLYAGIGTSTDDGEVWKYDKIAGTWLQIAGAGANASYLSWGANDDIESVYSLAEYDGEIYAGLGNSTADAEVWKWNGSIWTQVAGFGSSTQAWDGGSYEAVYSLAVFNGNLFATLGNTSGSTDGEVWKYNGVTWAQVGGDGIVTGSWTSSDLRESAYGLAEYKGKLYAGLGNSNNADAEVWVYGNDSMVQSATNSFTADTWYHVAATYDGSTMAVYVNGVSDGTASAQITPNDSAGLLAVGKARGSPATARSPGYFAGRLDEVRISSTKRNSFNTTTYSASTQTIRPNASVLTSDVSQFSEFDDDLASADGGSIAYRLSNDGGSTWYWWSSFWIESSSTNQANDESTVDAHIDSFPVGSGGIMWQAVLSGNGEQKPTIPSVRIDAYSDTENPNPPSELTAKSTDNEETWTDIASGDWNTYSSPYFSWTPPSDNGNGDNPVAGIAGYYVYFGVDPDGEPEQANYQTGNTYTASGLSSGNPYYLRIKSKDKAGNISSAWDAFTYNYDTVGPTTPATVSVSPSGYATTNSFTFSWTASTDTGSDIQGYQYKTDADEGDLSDWSDIVSERSITIADAAHDTGENAFYVRSVDNANNTSSSASVLYYFGGSGPSVPTLLGVTPQTREINDFTFTWSEPDTYSGEAGSLTYCYTVNTTPNENTCTYTLPGVKTVSGALATQVGLNTFYVVAKNDDDYGGGINYGSYASVTFTADTSAPGIPLNSDVSDISVKSSSTWRLTVSWNEPSDSGSGVSSYKIYRSTDGDSYSEVASTTGTAYVDTGLSQVDYYYKVKACDSVNNCGAYSSAVTGLPTGKYTSAATLTSDPAVSGITTKTATIDWSTDRTSDSRLQFGESSGSYFESEPSNSTQVTSHVIELENLSPGTTYYYRARWTDEDGNIGTSEEATFSTDAAPTVKDVTAKSIGLTSVTLQYTTTGSSSVKIYYGKTSAFGGVVEVATSTAETTYTTTLDDLEDGTKYYYKVNTFDTQDAEYEGTILSFTTLPAPKLCQLGFRKSGEQRSLQSLLLGVPIRKFQVS